MGRFKKHKFLVFIVFTVLLPDVVAQPPVYKIEKTGFSSPEYSEIAPVIFGNGILYCSDKRRTIIRKRTFENERLYNIYIARPADSLKWEKPEAVKGEGVPLVFYGPSAMAPDNSTIYFTSSVVGGRAARQKGLNNPLAIYSGTLNGNIITNIKEFEYNNQAYNVAHPSLSKDGKYLFFASDMPGGQGQSDLYYSENTGGKWSVPVNMGNKVNSPSKENYPYSHPSGRLYFSSDRPGGENYLGGMDIYFTSPVSGAWDDPIAMPAPVNSTADDYAFVADENLQTAYFTRFSGRNDDIFKVTSTIIRKVSCDTLQENNYCYEFTELNAVKFDTLPVPFRYTWNFGDGETAEGIHVEHCYKDPGDYVVRLDIFNLLTNEMEPNSKTYKLPVREIVQAYISAPDQCQAGQQIRLSADSTNLPGWNITQYYWNFGDETVLIGKEVDKTYLRQGTYSIQLIVTAAPDINGIVRETCVLKNINVLRSP